MTWLIGTIGNSPFIGTGRHVQADNKPITLLEWITGPRRLNLIAAQNVKFELEFF